jgi:hypothetical protein
VSGAPRLGGKGRGSREGFTFRSDISSFVSSREKRESSLSITTHREAEKRKRKRRGRRRRPDHARQFLFYFLVFL